MPRSPRPAETLDKLIGRNIRFFRTNKRFSQAALGRAVGVTFQQIQKYETGANRVDAVRLSQIADALGVRIERLFPKRSELRRGSKVGASVSDLLMNPYAVRALQAFANISNQRLRRCLLTVIETVAAQQRA